MSTPGIKNNRLVLLCLQFAGSSRGRYRLASRAFSVGSTGAIPPFPTPPKRALLPPIMRLRSGRCKRGRFKSWTRTDQTLRQQKGRPVGAADLRDLEPFRSRSVRTAACLARRALRPMRLFGIELLRCLSHLTLMFFDKASEVFYPKLSES